MIYIFDIDGTIADLTHRLHFIQQEPKDWDAFFDACDEDKPITDVIRLLNFLANEHVILLISGRSDRVLGKTSGWLSLNDVAFLNIFMRKDGDHRPDHIVKSELLDEVLRIYDRERIGGIFEDRKQVVDMYRARGFRVYQVAEGNF